MTVTAGNIPDASTWFTGLVHADEIQDYLVDPLNALGSVVNSVNQQERLSTTPISVTSTSPTLVVAYDGTPYVVGSGISFASGAFTVTDTGRYRWDAEVQWPVGSGAVWAFLMLTPPSGSAAPNQKGAIYTVMNSGHVTRVNPGGPIVLQGGSSVQLALQSPDGAIAANTSATPPTGVFPYTFSLERAG